MCFVDKSCTVFVLCAFAQALFQCRRKEWGVRTAVKGISLKDTMPRTVKWQDAFARQAVTTLEGNLSLNAPT